MPQLVIIAGPNGAGKTTVAFKIIPEFFNSITFVNADIIAQGLSAFDMPAVDFEAGRIMLGRLKDLRNSGKDFSFETTLSSKSFAPFLIECKKSGYKIIIIYVWLKDFSLAIDRVLNRKNEGGHFIPDEIVKRRYERSRRNFEDIYMPLADEWIIYNNSENNLGIIAEKRENVDLKIYNQIFWNEIMTKNIKEPFREYNGDRLHLLAKAAIREELIRKYKLNLPIVFMHKDKIISIEGKDLYKYVDWEEINSKVKDQKSK